jgi:hypothetical protein
MDLASVYYLGTTLALFIIYAVIVVRTCSGKRHDAGEAPKYRMMDEE